MKQAALVTTGLGIPLAVAEYPGAPMVDSDEEIRAKVANHISHWNAGEGGASAP